MADAGSGFLAFLTFGATLSVGAAGAWIGWQQKRIADRQRQNAEFDRLFSVYFAFSEFLRTPNEEMGVHLNTMNVELRKASLLFDEELHSYLHSYYTNCLTYMLFLDLKPPATDDPQAAQGYAFSLQERERNRAWLLQQVQEMPRRFRGYVQPITAQPKPWEQVDRVFSELKRLLGRPCV